MKRLALEPLSEVERAQLDLVLQNTTPAQRIEWLEEMRLAFGVENLRQAQMLKFRIEDLAKSLNSEPPKDR